MRHFARALAIVVGTALTLLTGAADGDAVRDDHFTLNHQVAPPGLTRTVGGPGSGPGEFNDPWHSAMDSQGRIVVADMGNNRIQVLDATGQFLFTFGSAGSAPSEFDAPRGVAIGSGDEIVVADTGNHRIQVFTSAGEFEFEFGMQGSGPGQLESPSGVHVAESGEVLVADAGNHRVQTFSATGAYVSSLGSLGSGQGEFDTPSDVTVGLHDLLYVAEQGNDRVSVFDSSGAFVGYVDDPDVLVDSYTGPTAVFVDDHDLVYVTDPGNSRLQVFADQSEGSFYIYRWPIAEEGEVNGPRSVTVDQAGKLFVVDGASSNLERWRFFRCRGMRATHVGTPGPDRLGGHPYDAVMVGLGGDDWIGGGFGQDIICAGKGNDTVHGGWQGDFVQGGPGRDVIEGGRGLDELRGGKGRDRVNGNASSDSVFGGAGNDGVFGGDSDDVVFGGKGDDLVRGGQGDDQLDGEDGTDTCIGGRGDADEYTSCEEILDRPAPRGWYWVRNLAAGFDMGIDLDPDTGLLWGVKAHFFGDTVAAQDHTGRQVAEYLVGGDAGLAAKPIAVQVFESELYVLGEDSKRVVVMGTDGSPRRHWGGAGTGPGEFESPCDLVVTESRVIVSEWSGRFQFFDHAGNFMSEFTGNDRLCRFTHLNGELYVASFDNDKVVVFGESGNRKREIGVGLLDRPRALDASPSGLIWVGGNGSFTYALTPSGEVVHTISGSETIMALTVDGSDHAVWTTHWVSCCHGEIRMRADVYTDLSCAGRRIEYLGTAYDDAMALRGDRHRIIHGGPGDDIIDAGSGDDYICGGDGADTLLGKAGNDFLFGEAGADTLRGGSGEDICDGGPGDNELFGCEATGAPR